MITVREVKCIKKTTLRNIKQNNEMHWANKP